MKATQRIFSIFVVLSLLMSFVLVTSVGAAGGPTVTTGFDATAVTKAGVRFRNFGSGTGDEVYLGIPDLGNSSNRVALNTGQPGDWTASNHIKFEYIPTGANNLKLTLDSATQHVLTYNLGDVGSLNYLQITVSDRQAGANVDFINVTLNTYPLGDFTITGFNDWQVKDLDFTSGFTIEGDLILSGAQPSSNELNKVELKVGYAVPPNQPPTANPGGPYLGAVNTNIVFDGTGSSDPDNNPLTYTWDFGDGDTGSGATPSHSYATPDIYDVCLIVNDGYVDSVEECTTAVVYDPSGGFVTGGGWIDSPEGAYKLNDRNITSLVWDQDFSSDDAGWLDDDDSWYGDISVAGGTATFYGDGSSAPFSRFDGYRSTWPGTWIAEIDVYLDPAWLSGQGFDYSVAANGSDGAHQRDYIFHVGIVENYGPITGRALLVNGSNNADFSTNPFKLVNDNGGNYYVVATAGWYTLQHAFRDAGGYLAVDLNLLDSGGNTIWTATRENVADTIPSEVGGNRYSWFTHIDVAGGIQVDNHQLFVPVRPTGKATFGFVSKYKKGASVPEGTTEFQFKAGGLNFHSTNYEWLVVNQGGTNAQFKGYGTINGVGNYGFMLWAGDGSPDTFRIKIWDAATEEVVYDNGQDQAIGGGNIVVHTKK